MTAEDVARELGQLLDTISEFEQDDLLQAGIEPSPLAPCQVRSFSDACLLTRDDGLVVTLADGSEYQITVVRSR